MNVTLKSPEFEGTYVMEKPISGEAHTTYREQWPHGRRGGEILFVSDTAFAYRSREPIADNQTILDEMMTAPGMVTQLAAILLDRGVRLAPAEVTAKPMAVAARSDTQFVRTESPAVTTLYAPPWRLSGTIHAAATGKATFVLRFTFRPVEASGRVIAGKSETIELSGTATYGNTRPRMPDSFDLVGWKLVKDGASLPSVATLAEARFAVGAR